MHISIRRYTIASMLAIVAGLTSCSDDADKPGTGEESAMRQVSTTGPLVIVTEREGPEGATHYLHVVRDWPSSGRLDDGEAIELGTPGVTNSAYGAIYFYHAEAGEIVKYAVDDKLNVTQSDVMSFSHYGVSGFDPEPIWVSNALAFMVDEKSAQVVRWNPSTMRIDSATPFDTQVRERDGLKLQLQLGIAANGRLFTTANWRNWDTNKVFAGAALGVFEQKDTAGGPKIIDDERCAASVAVGPWRAGDYIYLVGDGAQGFDMVANPNKSPNPQCVVRLRPDADEFEEDYFIDLHEVTGSPAIYMAYPMADDKLLVNMWSPDEDVNKHADPKAPGWYWEINPYFVYAIVDLKAKTSSILEDLPPAGIQSQKTLILDGHNYVQRFREDRGSTLYRVDTDGTVTQILDNPSGTDVQYLGRL